MCKTWVRVLGIRGDVSDVLDLTFCGGAPFGGPGNQPTVSNRCVIDYAAPRVRDADYFSYSSWQTINIKVSQPAANLLEAINAALGGSLELVRAGQIAIQGQSTVAPASFLLGEFGFGRTDYGEYNAARYIQEVVDAVRGPGAFGASYAIFWQVLDNAPPPWNSWGLFRGSNGQMTTLGTTFTALMNGQTPQIPSAGPEISPAGIVNAQPGPDQGTRNIHPNSAIMISGSNFSPSGNVVSVIQGNNRYVLSAGSTNWFESPTQITATFPNISGQALVFITNGGAIDSRAQLVVAAGDVGPVVSPLAAAVLPGSRSVQLGTTATAFASVINSGPTSTTDCRVALITGIGATFSFQATDPATNQVTGAPNVPLNIPAGAVQTLVLALTPTVPFVATDVQLNFTCSNTPPAPVVSGLDTLLLAASTTPTPDIVALGATASHDGIIAIPGADGTGAFAVATVNVGAGGPIGVFVDTGAKGLAVNLSVCETNSATGACLGNPSTSVGTSIDANATPTFAVFVSATGVVPFDPANNRIFIRFKDAGGVTRGATSVAVRTQ